MFSSFDWSSLFNPEYLTSGVLYLLAVVCFLAGILGCALPYPGHAVLLLGCILFAWAGKGSTIPAWVWVVESLLAVLGSFTDNLFALVGAKRFGCGSSALWCSALGMFLGGIFFFPIGLLVGPFLGAFLCEWVYVRKDLTSSLKSGTGALVGALLGIIAKFVVAAGMLILFFAV